MITLSDLNTLAYFWKEKGDVTKWVDWERKAPKLKTQYPALYRAIVNYINAEKILDAVFSSLLYGTEDDGEMARRLL